ncbi:hypothetical protein [Deinococcus sp. SL84]|uniref:hypothetical protein n=1 Tax=Deinococcus sp. SL84 TaxID=2994663 RepID=UPI0022722F58|nr:hypothetical protein [Deinococcus sp. SL84]MCY1703608.1 hypothetical protein [Deinococcus sp. SL84]
MTAAQYQAHRTTHPELDWPDESTIRARLGGWDNACLLAFRSYHPTPSLSGPRPLRLRLLATAVEAGQADPETLNPQRLLNILRRAHTPACLRHPDHAAIVADALELLGMEQNPYI